MNRCNVEKILKLLPSDNLHAIVNDKYLCRFVESGCTKEFQTHSFFSEWVRDENCPRNTCFAEVEILDQLAQTKYEGRIYLFFDEDLGNNGKYSMMLKFSDNCLNKSSMISITKFSLQESSQVSY